MPMNIVLYIFILVHVFSSIVIEKVCMFVRFFSFFSCLFVRFLFGGGLFCLTRVHGCAFFTRCCSLSASWSLQTHTLFFAIHFVGFAHDGGRVVSGVEAQHGVVEDLLPVGRHEGEGLDGVQPPPHRVAAVVARVAGVRQQVGDQAVAQRARKAQDQEPAPVQGGFN